MHSTDIATIAVLLVLVSQRIPGSLVEFVDARQKFPQTRHIGYSVHIAIISLLQAVDRLTVGGNVPRCRRIAMCFRLRRHLDVRAFVDDVQLPGFDVNVRGPQRFNEVLVVFGRKDTVLATYISTSS
jgi:hypothetical protein